MGKTMSEYPTIPTGDREVTTKRKAPISEQAKFMRDFERILVTPRTEAEKMEYMELKKKQHDELTGGTCHCYICQIVRDENE